MSNSGIADTGTGTCPPVATQQHKGNGKANGSAESSLIEPARVTTDFADLSDGTLLELVRPEGSGWNQFKFLSWNAGASSIVDSFRHGGNLLVPPKLDERLHRNLNLRLPTGVGNLLNARRLFVLICEFIREFIGLAEPRYASRLPSCWRPGLSRSSFSLRTFASVARMRAAKLTCCVCFTVSAGARY